MRKFKGSETPSRGMTGGERARLILMGAGAVVIAVALFMATQQAKAPPPSLDVPEQISARVELPTIPTEELQSSVDDRTPEARVRLERAPLETLLSLARRLTPAHYQAMGTPFADTTLLAQIEADPASWRGKTIGARGRLVELSTRRPNATAAPEHGFLVDLEGGGRVHGVTLSTAADLEPGDWVVFQGLFLKLYSDEAPDGTWVEAPLLVGSSLERSVAPVGPKPNFDPDDLLIVVDDTFQRVLGLDVPGRYELLAHARDAADGEHNFEAAPELDRTLLAQIRDDGQNFRGAALRLPISRVEVVRHQLLPENPARLHEVTEVWLTNVEWDKNLPTIGLYYPGRLTGIEKGDLVFGNLLFFKNYAFDSASSRHLAPFFVALDVERFELPEDSVMRQVLLGVAGLTVLMVVLLAVLVRRDRRRADQFERQRVESRQRRRKGGLTERT